MERLFAKYTRNPRGAAGLVYMSMCFPALIAIAAANPEVLPMAAGCLLAPIILGQLLAHRHPTASRLYAVYMAAAIALIVSVRMTGP